MAYSSPLIQVQVSKVVPARRWKVLRCLMHPADFPRYMPNVRECSLVARTREGTRTRWKVEMEGLPVSWVQEETLQIRNSALQFRLIEGDLQEFSGQWILKDHPEGTQVDVEVSLRVGIPQVEQIIGEALKEKVRHNFVSMLEAVENQIVDRHYEYFYQGGKNGIGGFAILGHPYNINHLVKYLKLLDPSFKMPSADFLAKIYDMVPPYKMFEIRNFKDPSGNQTHGWFIICPFIPQMVDMDVQAVYRKVVQACKLAQRFGAGIVGLGGFTSIVADRLGKELAQEVRIPVTTGNTLTSALTIEGIEKAAELMGVDISKSKMTIIGGTGNIGFACARVFASRVKSLTLTGRNEEKLANCARILKTEENINAVTTTHNTQAIKDADLVIACASASASLLDDQNFKPGVIICDVAYPKNISYLATERRDILIFSGGLVELPNPIDMGFDTGLPSLKTLYGCFAESILLALDGKYENFSRGGMGQITKESITQIRQIARRHGFKLAPFYWGNREVTEEEITAITRLAA